jgi:hypothetical protein
MNDVIKGYISKEDFLLQTNTNAWEQFQRSLSVGGTGNFTKFPDIWNGTGRINPAFIDHVVTTDINTTDIITKSPWVDVRSFMDGVAGRPTYATWYANQATTDVTASLLAAIAAVPTTPTGGNGGIVLLPFGNFKITSAITVPVYVDIIGHGSTRYEGSTIICSPDNTIDGLILSGNNIVKDLAIEKAVNGIKLNSANYCRIDNVTSNYCTLGLWLYNSIWNTIIHFDAQHCTTGGKLDGDTTGNTYSNNNTFIGSKFHLSTGDGFVKNRGKGNVWLGCNFENNGATGITFDNNEAAWTYPGYSIPSYTGNDSLIGCWFEANTAEAIYVKEEYALLVQNNYVANSEIQTYGVIRLEKTKDIKIEGGTIIDFNDTRKPLYIGSQSYFTDIDIDYHGRGATTDYGTNTSFGRREIIRSLASEAILTDECFETLGAGGADVFDSWTEGGNDGITGGTITADTTDLIWKGTVSAYSCKFVMVASPSTQMFVYQAGTINVPNATFYAVIEYKNDTGSTLINDPLRIYIYDQTNDKFWDPVTRTWPNNTTRTIYLPLSEIPTWISIPFVLPAAGPVVIRLLIGNTATGSDAASSTHHIYSASLQSFKERASR